MRLAGVLVLLAAHPAQAQVRFDVGPRAGFDLVGRAEGAFVGLDGRVDFAPVPVLVNGAFDVYFVKEEEDEAIEFWQLSLNVFYAFDPDGRGVDPYVGAGLGVTRVVDTTLEGSGTTDGEINLIGGASFAGGRLRPFAQVQLTVGPGSFVAGPSLLTLSGGLLWRVGR